MRANRRRVTKIGRSRSSLPTLDPFEQLKPRPSPADVGGTQPGAGQFTAPNPQVDAAINQLIGQIGGAGQGLPDFSPLLQGMMDPTFTLGNIGQLQGMVDDPFLRQLAQQVASMQPSADPQMQSIIQQLQNFGAAQDPTTQSIIQQLQGLSGAATQAQVPGVFAPGVGAPQPVQLPPELQSIIDRLMSEDREVRGVSDETINLMRGAAGRLDTGGQLAELDPQTQASLEAITNAMRGEVDLKFEEDRTRLLEDLFGRGVQRSTIAGDAGGRLLFGRDQILADILGQAAQRELATRSDVTNRAMQESIAQGQAGATIGGLEQAEGALQLQQIAQQLGALQGAGQLGLGVGDLRLQEAGLGQQAQIASAEMALRAALANQQAQLTQGAQGQDAAIRALLGAGGLQQGAMGMDLGALSQAGGFQQGMLGMDLGALGQASQMGLAEQAQRANMINQMQQSGFQERQDIAGLAGQDFQQNLAAQQLQMAPLMNLLLPMLGGQQAMGEAGRDRAFTGSQADIARQFQAQQEELARQFQGQESELDRLFRGSEAEQERNLSRELAELQAELARRGMPGGLERGLLGGLTGLTSLLGDESGRGGFLNTLGKIGGGLAKVGGILFSDEAYKTDIRGFSFPEDLLEAVRKVPLREYRYKGSPKKQTGFILQEAPEDWRGPGGTVDMANLVGYLLGAIQTLAQKIEVLENGK